MSSVLYINLRHINDNIEAVNRRIDKGVIKMAVVKDRAYGHGLLPVSQFMKDKVEWFCVADIDEAITLRDDGIKNPILVFEIPKEERAEDYLKYNLTASIGDLRVFDFLKEGTKAHIKIDTGMWRLGIRPEQSSDLLHKIQQNPHIKISGIYTHFANADTPEHPKVKEQLEAFKQMRPQFPSEWMTHAANSGAIFYYDKKLVQYDAVRPGVCLYGYAPGKESISDLKVAASWKARLVQVKEILQGESVGYLGRWKSPQKGQLGIIQVGYADGIPRSMSGKFNVEIQRKLYPQVGIISMDYAAVFLGDDEYQAGTEITLLDGENLKVESWAEIIDTIPYEIITGIQQDIKRVYIR